MRINALYKKTGREIRQKAGRGNTKRTDAKETTVWGKRRKSKRLLMQAQCFGAVSCAGGVSDVEIQSGIRNDQRGRVRGEVQGTADPVHEEKGGQTRLRTRPGLKCAGRIQSKRRPRVRTPALHLTVPGIFVDFSRHAGGVARIFVKWESEDDFNRARNDLVSENALLGSLLETAMRLGFLSSFSTLESFLWRSGCLGLI